MSEPVRHETIKKYFRILRTSAQRVGIVALCIGLTGCPMTLRNDVQSARLTTSAVSPTKAKIVYGLDASKGSVIFELDRYDPAPGTRRCSQARAQTPQGSTTTTYFAFDVPPGRYMSPYVFGGRGRPAFVVPAGQLVYIGNVVIAPPERLAPPFEFGFSSQGLALVRDLGAAKAALGLAAANMQLADLAPAGEVPVGFVCLP